MKIGYKDIYETYSKLIIHSESISWQRFHVFLVVNSVLVLSWVTLSRDSQSLSTRLILGAISVVGMVAAVAWEDLGDRGRGYLDKYKEKARQIETDNEKSEWWESGIDVSDRPFQVELESKWYSSSKFLLRLGPIVFLMLHAGLLAAALIK